MNRLYKTLLIWLLVFAIPIQGLAAGMQISCGPMHHDSVANATEASHTHQHDGGGQTHQHHDGMMQHADDGSQHNHDVAKAESKAGTCSACASCCVGAAVIPSALKFTPIHSALGTLVAEPSSSFTGYVPAGLERPPRFILS